MTFPPQVQIRALSPDDDLDAQLDLTERAFGRLSASHRDQWREGTARLIEDGRALGAFVGGRMAGGAMFFDMRQWWCGREVPMAGVASVRVAPEDRGQGIGRALMTALLDLTAARGYPVSVLYPATMPLYRSLGWELAGGKHTAVIPARSLRALPPPDVAAKAGGDRPPLRRAGPGDADAVISVIGRVHEAARDAGPVTWDAATVGRWLADRDLYAYLSDDGFVACRWDNAHADLRVQRALGVSPATVRGLWEHVASYGSVAERVHAVVGPADAFWWLARERDADMERRELWMLRVADAPAAIAARGFPAAVSAAVPLLITDTARPANSGPWELTVAEGKAALTPAGPRVPGAHPPLALGARGLAALYAGTPVVTLRRAGLASGGSPHDDAVLDAAFAATPYMLDGF
jgi:predicted acetyltransferase